MDIQIRLSLRSCGSQGNTVIQRGETLTEVETENGGGRVKGRGQRENPSRKSVSRKETQDSHSLVRCIRAGPLVLPLEMKSLSAGYLLRIPMLTNSKLDGTLLQIVNYSINSLLAVILVVQSFCHPELIATETAFSSPVI